MRSNEEEDVIIIPNPFPCMHGAVQGFPVQLGVYVHQQWDGAEDGEGIRPVAGTGNESEEKNRL